MIADQRGPTDVGPRALSKKFYPYRSAVIAFGLAAVTLQVRPQLFRGSVTEAVYFLLAPYYAAVGILRARECFGVTRNEVSRNVVAGLICCFALYSFDFVDQAFVGGGAVVRWIPTDVTTTMFGVSGGIVETVIFQLGVQARMNGWIGVGTAAVLFVAVHLSVNPIFLIAGLALALLQAWTKRPGSTVIAHCCYNIALSIAPPIPIH